ncbi:leucine-rich repeat-containing protein 23 [Lampris incognitus]|uniref:leucine-rich repeat-containing protein 23 n=1 Tax=Lampris incognitus TaxID=2546036 RepID=UPI0024B49606|nr:leucine-rich repeat-containing protein 23 [Lampris incognitus]
MSDGEEDAVLTEAEEEEGEGREEEEQIQVRPLTPETIIQGLSLLCRTGNGLSHAFVKLDLREKGLTDIDAIGNYIHLRFLDVSNNHLTDLSPLASLNQLLWLKIDKNAVASFKGQPLDQLTYLQWLSLTMNKLQDLEGLAGPALENLILTGNSIQRVSNLENGQLTNLVTLELRGNSLETTDGIYLPNLRRLYLAQNGIKRLEGLEKLERLNTLHLRDNQLETLDGIGPNMKSLQYLNVRGNVIFSQRALRSLRHVSGTLRTLVLSENPLEDSGDYRLYVLTCLPQLERLDKEPVSSEERTEAKDRMKELKEEEDT